MSPRRPIMRPDIAPRLSLTLYVAGDNAFSRDAQVNLRSIMVEMDLHAPLSIIDVLKDPELTMKKRIFVTPTLVVVTDAGTESLIVGDFSKRDKIVGVLRDLSQHQ